MLTLQSKGPQKRRLRPLLQRVHAFILVGLHLRIDPDHFDVLLTVTGFR